MNGAFLIRLIDMPDYCLSIGTCDTKSPHDFYGCSPTNSFLGEILKKSTWGNTVTLLVIVSLWVRKMNMKIQIHNQV